MAIELITGLPGHGKTLYTISRYKEIAEKEGRPVYFSGIKGLKLPWKEHDPKAWQDLPPNAIFIIDEAQFTFPVRGRGAPDEWIQKLSVHRHGGIDIVLITQGPMLIDSFVRTLCDRHRHVVRKFGTHFATIHEYPNGVRDLVLKSRGDDSIKHEWRYPKDVFELYHSAEVHTVKRRIPLRVWMLLAVPFLVAAFGWMAYKRLNPTAQGERVSAGAGVPHGAASRPGGDWRGGYGGKGEKLGVQAYVELHKPRIAGLAYTAPLYDEVTKPSDAPYPAACIANDKRCQCYSQQGTRLEVPDDLCRSISAGGFFVAWKGQQDHIRPTFERTAAASPPPTPAPAWGFNAGEMRAGLAPVSGPAAAASGVDGSAPAGRVRR